MFGDSPYWISEKNQGIDGTGYYYFNDYFQPEYSQPFKNYKYIWKNETKVSKLAGTECNSYDVCKPIGTWSNIQNGDKKIEIIVEYYTTNKIGTYCKVLDFNSLEEFYPLYVFQKDELGGIYIDINGNKIPSEILLKKNCALKTKTEIKKNFKNILNNTIPYEGRKNYENGVKSETLLSTSIYSQEKYKNTTYYKYRTDGITPQYKKITYLTSDQKISSLVTYVYNKKGKLISNKKDGNAYKYVTTFKDLTKQDGLQNFYNYPIKSVTKAKYNTKGNLGTSTKVSPTTLTKTSYPTWYFYAE